jgi:signal transduction histidine kinase
MFSGTTKHPQRTAAWRLSIGTTLAFALGTAVAFVIIYIPVADSIRQRTDAWLSGEADVLADIAMNTPQDNLYDRIVAEAAELATREVPEEDDENRGREPRSVFFLQTSADTKSPLWVGPGSKELFLQAIEQTRLTPGIPQSIRVDGFPNSFRVVTSRPERGGVIYLGLSDRSAQLLLAKLTRRFVLVWVGMVLLGFIIAYTSARRTLRRVEQITETVARLGTDDLASRLPDATHSDEISRLSRTFNQMLDRIQASVNQLRTVTDSVAHDLKSPVTSIRGRLEVALSNDDNSSWREPVAEAVESLDRMAQLLNTTLDLSEAAGGALQMNRSRIDLSALLHQLADLYLPALAERHQELRMLCDEHIAIDGDVSLMSRVVGNLLDNELTHLPAGCHIELRLSTREGRASLQIRDNGPGFPPDLRHRAFERFVKGGHSPGHGLGLAFVDAVVRAHGGTATISDRPNGGAIITLLLPLASNEGVRTPNAHENSEQDVKVY